MSALAQARVDYLALRRSVGYKLVEAEFLLRSFVDFMEHSGASTVTAQLATQWAVAPTGASRGWHAQRLSVVRGFASYLSAFDSGTQIPARGWLPGPEGRVAPYIYSDDEVAGLMRAARTLSPRLLWLNLEVLVGLLAASGLRVGEALALNISSVEAQRRVITVAHAKLNSTREIPVTQSTLDALAAMLSARELLGTATSEQALFVNSKGTRLSYASAQTGFARLLGVARVKSKPPRRRPRLHDLRHSFAVASLIDITASGRDARVGVATLSAYLGHVDPSSTYWYLEATPALLRTAADQLERAGQL